MRRPLLAAAALTLFTRTATAQPPPAAPLAPAAPAPAASAAEALDRAAAAYEYGDMNQVVDATRPIADGALAASADQRAEALRLLGIGLYLTNRAGGAEAAFTELLRLQPRARLDRTTTRPEVVAHFEQLKRRHAQQVRASKRFVYNFLPPVGQFQNGDNGRAYALLGVGVAAFGTALGTSLALRSWRKDGPGNLYEHPETAKTLQKVNYLSFGLLAATYAVGVVDAILRYGHVPIDGDDVRESSLSWAVTPAGAAARFTF